LVVLFFSAASITGNSIFRSSDDATYRGVLGMLSNCEQVDPDPNLNLRCSETCRARGEAGIASHTEVS